MADEVRVVENHHENQALSMLHKVESYGQTAQVEATLAIAAEVRLLREYLEKLERDRVRAIFARAKLGPF